jgi:hypothetical protein
LAFAENVSSCFSKKIKIKNLFATTHFTPFRRASLILHRLPSFNTLQHPSDHYKASCAVGMKENDHWGATRPKNVVNKVQKMAPSWLQSTSWSSDKRSKPVQVRIHCQRYFSISW